MLVYWRVHPLGLILQVTTTPVHSRSNAPGSSSLLLAHRGCRWKALRRRKSLDPWVLGIFYLHEWLMFMGNSLVNIQNNFIIHTWMVWVCLKMTPPWWPKAKISFQRILTWSILTLPETHISRTCKIKMVGRRSKNLLGFGRIFQDTYCFSGRNPKANHRWDV